MDTEKKVTIAVNGGIGFGAKLTPKQLVTLAEHIEEGTEIELTTFQQLYIQVAESKVEQVKAELETVGFSCYPVGNYVKSLRTCNFCKGAEQEGMPVAIELNKRIAGQAVPFTLSPAYTGCPNACGEPLVNDIGVLKRKDKYELYIGGKAKGEDAKTGVLFRDQLTPDELFNTVDQLISIYRNNGKKREKFSKFIARYGFDQLKREVVV